MTDAFLSAVELWWRWMSAMSVQVAVLALIVAALDRAFARRTWPEMIAALWALVLIKLVAPPTLTSPVSLARLSGSDGGHSDGIVAAPGRALPAVLFALWLAGAAVLFLWMWRRYGTLRREWLPESSAAPTGDVLRCAGRIAAAMGLSRMPMIRIRPGSGGAAVVGFFRPIVVVPSDLLAGKRRVQLEHVLMHEFAHIRRRDPLWGLAGLLLQIVYWFHPLVWLTRARLATLREVCCDRAVAAVLGSNASDYRGTLLRLARPMIERGALGGLAFIQRHSQLLSRLDWLERPLPRRTTVRRIATAAILAILLACCVPLAPPLPTAGVPPVALDALPGCMQRRYLVLSLLAQQERIEALNSQ